jgi:hypothetical protein
MYFWILSQVKILKIGRGKFSVHDAGSREINLYVELACFFVEKSYRWPSFEIDDPGRLASQTNPGTFADIFPIGH